jgi:hypothetical protein
METRKIIVTQRLTVKPSVKEINVPSGATTLATALTEKGIMEGAGM